MHRYVNHARSSQSNGSWWPECLKHAQCLRCFLVFLECARRYSFYRMLLYAFLEALLLLKLPLFYLNLSTCRLDVLLFPVHLCGLTFLVAVYFVRENGSQMSDALTMPLSMTRTILSIRWMYVFIQTARMRKWASAPVVMVQHDRIIRLEHSLR